MLGPPKSRDLDRPVLIAIESYVPAESFPVRVASIGAAKFAQPNLLDRSMQQCCEDKSSERYQQQHRADTNHTIPLRLQ